MSAPHCWNRTRSRPLHLTDPGPRRRSGPREEVPATGSHRRGTIRCSAHVPVILERPSKVANARFSPAPNQIVSDLGQLQLFTLIDEYWGSAARPLDEDPADPLLALVGLWYRSPEDE